MLDMADKYPPAEAFEDEPTVKVDMNAILPKVIVEEDDFEPTLPSARTPVFPQEKTYPGIGLLIAFGTGLAFWGTVAYFLAHC